MKPICWAYTEDGRVCRQPATTFDQQRGFTVCAKHSVSREQQTRNPVSLMSKTKPPPPGGPAAPAATTSTEQHEFRNNPEIDTQIDAYIKEHPKFWARLQAMPRDRLERTVILNEVQKLSRQQRINDGVMKQINRDPDLKQAYETLVRNVPEDQREAVMAQVARDTMRTLNRSQAVGQTI